ncbi:MAG: Rossmann-fold NAD(P)-binding domain-containing protein [Desulfitobacteriaceae bacterium]
MKGLKMDIAVIGTSKKENEKRVAIHPDHISQIPVKIRKHLFFEKGYGIPFDMEDETICSLTGNRLIERKKLLRDFKTILIIKPVAEDFEEIQDGSLVWGWLHSVQQSIITQIAIDKKLTLIAWENMYYQGERDLLHIFNKNNEMAGYCGVQHALQLTGIDGNFGPTRKVMVISLGSVSRGAIYALEGHGFSDITVYTQRPSFLAANKIPGIQYKQIIKDDRGVLETVNLNGEKTPLVNELATADIIVNGVLQNPNNPVIFINDNDIVKFTKTCLVIDISCAMGMGFSFAHPTNFSNPIFKIGNIKYYAVDHTPTLLWNSASWEISNGILPYLPYIVEQSDNKVLNDAIDIKDGKILNRDILSYQNRSLVYPYKQL